VIGSMTTMLQLTPVLARMHMLELMEAPMYWCIIWGCSRRGESFFYWLSCWYVNFVFR
jgi:hypothetical protein